MNYRFPLHSIQRTSCRCKRGGYAPDEIFIYGTQEVSTASRRNCIIRRFSYRRRPSILATNMNRLASRLRALIPTREQIMENRWLAWLRPFLAHPRLWHWSRRGVALGVAIGVFFGLLIPIAQIPFSAAAAVLLRANVPAAAASTLVTNPVTFGPVYYAAYKLGVWIHGGEAADAPPKPASAENEDSGLLDQLGKLGLPLITGLAIMAVTFGFASYAIISAIWYWRVKSRRRQAIHYYQTKNTSKSERSE